MVSGGRVVKSTMHQSYSSAVNTRTERLLQTIAMNEGLNMIVGDIGNVFVQAHSEETIWSRAGPEFGDIRKAQLSYLISLWTSFERQEMESCTYGDVLKTHPGLM